MDELERFFFGLKQSKVAYAKTKTLILIKLLSKCFDKDYRSKVFLFKLNFLII